MESNDKLKEIDIKNLTSYYFDDIIRTGDFDVKIYTKIFYISCKNLINSKPLSIRFYKKNGFIRVYDGTRYLVLFGSEKI